MSQYELAADKIEEVINQMFTDFRDTNTGATEFSILFNPKKHNTWFIVVFFKDKTQLKESLNNGACYSLHRYLLTKFDEQSVLRNIERLILFEPGERPLYTIEFEELFNRMTEKLRALQNSSGNTSETVCSDCGHDFNAHQLMFTYPEGNETAKEGWIVCPEESCTCFKTWSANYKSIPTENS